MNSLLRVLIALTAYVLAYVFSFGLLLMPLAGSVGAGLFAALPGFAAARYAWRKTAPPALASSRLLPAVGMGAVVGGTLGFVGGFIGPLLFMPEANQGPLLGFFVTGPLGLALGGLAGGLWWNFRPAPPAK